MDSTITDSEGRVYNVTQDEGVDEDTFKLVLELSDPKADQTTPKPEDTPSSLTFEQMGL
jgi:hypothetical protein